MTTLQSLLGNSLPIIQAPMAGVQGSALAIAVSNAGGLGSLPGAMLSLDALRTELAAIQAHTDKPFNVNFFAIRRLHPAPCAKRLGAERWHRITTSMTLIRTPFPLGRDAPPSMPSSPPCSKPSSHPSSAFILGCLLPTCWRACAPGALKFWHQQPRLRKHAGSTRRASMPLLPKGWRRVAIVVCSCPTTSQPKWARLPWCHNWSRRCSAL